MYMSVTEAGKLNAFSYVELSTLITAVWQQSDRRDALLITMEKQFLNHD